MNKKFKSKTLSVILNIFMIAIPGRAFAFSLDSYLGNNMGIPENYIINASNQHELFENHIFSRSPSRSYGTAMSKIHKYMGYGTMVSALAAGVSGSDDGFHKGAGNAAAALAVATCITGFMEYGNYFDMSEGLSAHNIHIVLGTIATAGFVATAIDANSNDDDGHAGLGIGSGILMTVPIIILHF